MVLQIEDPEPLAELDEIAALPGYDMLFFGPGDFSHALGDPGNFNHPELIAARQRVARAAAAHGKFAGTVASLDNYQSLVAEGYRFISIGADVVFLGGSYRSLIRQLVDRGETAPAAGPVLYRQ